VLLVRVELLSSPARWPRVKPLVLCRCPPLSVSSDIATLDVYRLRAGELLIDSITGVAGKGVSRLADVPFT